MTLVVKTTLVFDCEQADFTPDDFQQLVIALNKANIPHNFTITSVMLDAVDTKISYTHYVSASLLDLPEKVYMALWRGLSRPNQFFSIGHICDCSADEILAVNGIGPKNLVVIQKALAEYGLALRDE